MAEVVKKYSYQIHACETMTDDRLIKDTVITVAADNLDEAVNKAQALLGRQAKVKRHWWCGSVVEFSAVVK